MLRISYQGINIRSKCIVDQKIGVVFYNWLPNLWCVNPIRSTDQLNPNICHCMTSELTTPYQIMKS